MNRLKVSQIKAHRDKLLEYQYNRCALCGELLLGSSANLDHDHNTGLIRGVIHRDCNTLLGKIENFCNTFGHANIKEFLSRVYQYMTEYNSGVDIYHPSYRTAEEKRLAKNARARKQRKLKRSKNGN